MMSGAKSSPFIFVGINLRTKAYAGFVTLYKNCTIGLYGSGLTKLKSAEIMITHIYTLISEIKIPPIP
jgi:hypothetical protein